MRLILSLKGSAGNFEQFANSFGAERKQNFFSVHNSLLKASCYCVLPEPELEIFVCDFIFNKKFSFSVKRQLLRQDKFYFALYGMPSQNTTVLVEQNNRQRHLQMHAPSLLLISEQQNLRIVFGKNSSFSCIAFLFTPDLFQKYTELVKSNGEDAAGKELLSSFLSRQLSKVELAITNILLDAIEKKYSAIEVKGMLYTLLSSIRREIPAEINKPSPQNKYTNMMVNVARKISSSLYKPMPSLDELSREFYISPSTLKRQFKNVFGKSLYEYYLEKKMELAKTMLETGNEKVTAVAFLLGYESPSHFISSFKKVHGYSPGKLKKQ